MGIRQDYAHPDQRPLTPEPHQGKHLFGLGMWHRFHGLFNRDEPHDSDVQSTDETSLPGQTSAKRTKGRPFRKVGVGLPRQATFKRQNSEKRDRLLPVQPCPEERRAISSSRQVSLSVPRHRSKSTPPLYNPARTSAPAVAITSKVDDQPSPPEPLLTPNANLGPPDMVRGDLDEAEQRPTRPPSVTSSIISHDARLSTTEEKAKVNAELDTRWILNLSMHFRDKSDREKFFVTYAETPTKWRRVTVSCDYRNAEPGSLEMDLKELQFQRDKNLQIYESIRGSLPEIQFYDTVTNLKLETREGRLHVHVTEDVNEIIPYPPKSTVAHILNDPEYRPREVAESELVFDSHLSGFVYKVKCGDQTFIKKEIPGPDTVDEFLYEINALHALHDSEHVIQLEAIVVDDAHQLVKGLLISYAEQGAIVDLLYDLKGQIPWEDRLRWARDAVIGLSEIHEGGYVQGDFTLSNIVVDASGNAKIIDINRRGCPVGWEPPEIATKIASHQRISMYIGEKSDIYQLGMTLWGLAADDDEPERHDPPLNADDLPAEIPYWYKRIVANCLETRPRDRLSAKELASMFQDNDRSAHERFLQRRPGLALRMQKRYIDPSQAVERDDIERLNYACPSSELLYSPGSSRFDESFTYPHSSNCDRGSEISDYERPRGRQPPTNLEHLNHRERQHWAAGETHPPSMDEAEAQILSISPGMEPQYDEIEIDGRPFLIAHNTFSDEELQILEHQSSLNGIANVAQQAVEEESQLQPKEGQPRPPLRSAVSATSGSTPRNSQTLMAESSMTQSHRPDSSPADFQGMGSSWELSGEAPGSPSQLRPTHMRRESASPQPPPSLTYADSGFHEPSTFDDLEHAYAEVNYAAHPVRTETENQVRAEAEHPFVQVSDHTHGSHSRPRTFTRTDTAIRLDPADFEADISPKQTNLPEPLQDETAVSPEQVPLPEPLQDEIEALQASISQEVLVEQASERLDALHMPTESDGHSRKFESPRTLPQSKHSSSPQPRDNVVAEIGFPEVMATRAGPDAFMSEEKLAQSPPPEAIFSKPHNVAEEHDDNTVK